MSAFMIFPFAMVEWRIDEARVAYPDAVAFMEKRVAAIHNGSAPECVWALEHPPLYTAGTSARAEDLIDARFPVHDTGRGGQYTYHGPGQLVCYVMLDLKKRQQQPDIRDFVWRLEEWIIRALSRLGVYAERRDGRVGLWVAMKDGSEAKIAAIGVRVRRWVTYHGISINIDPDLSHFGGIVPCGLAQFGVTSLADLKISSNKAMVISALQESWNGVFDQSAAKGR